MPEAAAQKSFKIGYARVSKKEQNEELQIQALEKAGCNRIFVEKISSLKEHRPELEKAMAMLREGDVFVAWRYDRFARSTKELLDMVGGFNKRGIGFVSLTENVDTNTAMGKLYFTILAGFAEFERGLIQERTKAGLAARKASGKKLGPKYKLSDKAIDMALAALDNPATCVAQVAKELKVGTPTLYRELDRRKPGWSAMRGSHSTPPLLDYINKNPQYEGAHGAA